MNAETVLKRTPNQQVLPGDDRVSVIIPTLNRPEFLEECVRSVLAQTAPAHEIIIVNDGSNPRCQAELDRIASFSDRIFLYNLPSNSGRSCARNFGLDKSTGDFVLFLDDDDLLEAEMLATSLRYFQNSDVDIVISLCKVMHLPSVQPLSPHVSYLFDCTDESLKMSQRKFLETSPFSCIWKWCPSIHSSLIRRSSLGEFRFLEDLATGEDWYLWLSLANANRRFKCNPDAHAYVRRHSGNSIRWPSWFSGERTRFLNKIVESGMIQNSGDRALLHLRLFLSRIGWKPSVRDLLMVFSSPFELLRCGGNYLTRKIRWSWNSDGQRYNESTIHAFHEKSPTVCNASVPLAGTENGKTV